jgi:hypothetical protein
LYAQQRWLDPSTGRFLSLDPYPGELDVPMSTQGHTYLQGNPTSGVDPDGRCGPGGAAVGAVLGAAFGGIGAAYQNWGQSGHGFTKAVMKGVFLGGAGGAATGLTCGVGAALGIGTGVGAATSGITAMETAESWSEVGAAAGKGAAVGFVAGVAGAAVSGFAGAGASALTNSASAATKVVAQTAAEFGAGTVTSAAVQYATSEDGTIDWGQALIDGGAAAAGYGASRYQGQSASQKRQQAWLRGEEIASPELLALAKRVTPRDVITVDTKSKAYRDWDDPSGPTNAMMNGKDMFLRPDARKIEVLEEMLHFTQEKVGKRNERFRVETVDNYPVYEVHVKDFMIRHRKMLGISDGDTQVLQNMLKTQLESKVDARGQPLKVPRTTEGF